MLDQRVGALQDVAGRAVVLLELEELRLRPVAAELLQVLDPRAPPPVYRLIVVPYDERRALTARDQLHPRVLDRVRVLELVDQHVAEARTVVAQHFGLVAQQLERAQQQLGEVDHAGARAGVLVILVELDELAARRVVAVLQRLRAQALVLLVVDEPGDLARHPARLVESLALEELLHHAQLVLGIEDLEALWQACFTPMQAQQAVRDAVEGADPERAARDAEQPLDARAHLGRGLVGEGDREDAVRRGALGLDQPGHPVGEHARLATARTGKHQHRADGAGDRRALRVVQRREDRGEVHGAAYYAGGTNLSST